MFRPPPYGQCPNAFRANFSGASLTAAAGVSSGAHGGDGGVSGGAASVSGGTELRLVSTQ